MQILLTVGTGTVELVELELVVVWLVAGHTFAVDELVVVWPPIGGFCLTQSLLLHLRL